MGIVFRRARAADAERLTALVEELGYPSAQEAVRARLERVLSQPDQAVFVGEEGAEVLGWLHVQENLSLATDPCAVVAGLVVATGARRRGIGRGLMDLAEEWSRARGLGAVRLRSRASRVAAHAFYRRLGYEVTKKQLQFRKDL